MADKVEKPKKSKPKPKKDERGVLAALPSTRHERIGSRRVSAPKTFAQPEAAQAAASTGRTKPAAKKRAAAKSSPTAKQATAAQATATRRKAAAPRTFEPTPAAESAAGAADERAATPPPPRPAPEPRPRAVREGAPGMGTSGERGQRALAGDEPRRGEATSGDERSDAESSEHGRPSGVELVTTAVQAAGELTQIGLTIGGQIIKRAVDKLPKP